MRAVGFRNKPKTPDINERMARLEEEVRQIQEEIRQPEVRILFLADIENLLFNLPPIGPGMFSLSTGLRRVIKGIARSIGSIENKLAFLPPHLIPSHGEELHRLGFTIIACPKVHAKETGKEDDTVDSTLIEVGKREIRRIQRPTHLCLGSGDKDFSLLVDEAIQRGLKIIIVASSKNSLSNDLINLSDQVFFLFSAEDKQ